MNIDCTMSELLPEPSPPEDWECCGSECGDYCVFEIYRREKQAYDEQQQHLQQQTQQQNLIENA